MPEKIGRLTRCKVNPIYYRVDGEEAGVSVRIQVGGLDYAKDRDRIENGIVKAVNAAADADEVMGKCEVCAEPLTVNSNYHTDSEGVMWCARHEREDKLTEPFVRPTPPGASPECFDCGGFGPCDVCDNPPSSAEDIARDLHRHGLLRPVSCGSARDIIERHIVANSQLAGTAIDLADACRTLLNAIEKAVRGIRGELSDLEQGASETLGKIDMRIDELAGVLTHLPPEAKDRG